jgi:hypothetical protein
MRRRRCLRCRGWCSRTGSPHGLSFSFRQAVSGLAGSFCSVLITVMTSGHAPEESCRSAARGLGQRSRRKPGTVSALSTTLSVSLPSSHGDALGQTIAFWDSLPVLVDLTPLAWRNITPPSTLPTNSSHHHQDHHNGVTTNPLCDENQDRPADGQRGSEDGPTLRQGCARRANRPRARSRCATCGPPRPRTPPEASATDGARYPSRAEDRCSAPGTA